MITTITIVELLLVFDELDSTLVGIEAFIEVSGDTLPTLKFCRLSKSITEP